MRALTQSLFRRLPLQVPLMEGGAQLHIPRHERIHAPGLAGDEALQPARAQRLLSAVAGVCGKPVPYP